MTKRQGSANRFYVRLMRPVFQTAVLAIEANTEEDAALIALHRAPRIDERSWTGRFDRRYYTYDVQTLVGDDIEGKASKGDLGPNSDFRYLLLKADLYVGEGKLLVQPWFAKQGDLMIADLARDWCRDLTVIGEEGMAAYRTFLREVAGLGSAVEHKGNVITFRPRGTQDKDKT